MLIYRHSLKGIMAIKKIQNLLGTLLLFFCQKKLLLLFFFVNFFWRNMINYFVTTIITILFNVIYLLEKYLPFFAKNKTVQLIYD